MKIAAIQALRTAPPPVHDKTSKVKNSSHVNSKFNNNPHLQLVDTNYNQLMVNKKQINFTGVKNTSLEFIKQLPLEDRLASLFENFQQGDLIITGKNIKEAKKALYETASLIKNVIKRTFFVEDNNIQGNLGFIKNKMNDIEVINANPFSINLLSGGKSYELESNKSFYVVPNDILQIQESLLTIKDKPKIDLSIYRKNFAKAFDFTNSVEPEIEKLNKKSISLLANEAGKTPSKVTFADVGGQDKLINEMKKSILYPIRYPRGYENIDVNHGFILYGPPGTGKTHIARALANEADANFISLNGLDLESKWVGESEANWRNLFAEAKENQPTIIFIDEFDAIARSRDNSSNEYGNRVVNQILTLMTDIDNEADNVFVIGATNNFKSLDSAITRSGRFGKHLEVKLPDLEGTKKILDIHTKKKPLDKSVDKEKLAQKLFDIKASGADIKYIVNEAHSYGYERAGIFQKMENKTLSNKDIDNFSITNEDINKALEDFTASREVNKRKPIGYNKN